MKYYFFIIIKLQTVISFIDEMYQVIFTLGRLKILTVSLQRKKEI